MSRARQSLGRRGEQLAADYLDAQGLQILARNWRFHGLGEIDLVAQDGDSLVVVEVRTRRSHTFGSPEESITPAKQARLAALAAAYQDEVQWPGPLRIDVVAVVVASDGRLERLSHLRNAVGA